MNNEEHGNGSFNDYVAKTIGDHSRKISKIETDVGRKFIDISTQIEGVGENVCNLSEIYGKIIAKISSIENSLYLHNQSNHDLFDKIVSLDLCLSQHRSKCISMHSNIVTKDEFDVDTGVYSAMPGKDIKNTIEEEKRSRCILQEQVNDLIKEKLINDREKNAVALAKKEWEDQKTKLAEQQYRNKIALYGMYSAIIVAVVTVIGTILTSILKS